MCVNNEQEKLNLIPKGFWKLPITLIDLFLKIFTAGFKIWKKSSVVFNLTYNVGPPVMLRQDTSEECVCVCVGNGI